MLFQFDLILTATPQDTRAASLLNGRIAHLAYRVGHGLTLQRGSIGSSMRGGLMVLSDDTYDGSRGDVSSLCREVLRECSARNFEGIVADFEQAYAQHLEQFVTECAPQLRQRGMSLFVNTRYANLSPDSRVIIPTAMVSGSLRQRLAQAQERYGHRLAIEIERIARDITLPDPQSQGARLDRAQLQALLDERQVFFSQELCTHYFTYKQPDTGETHFVLFDDAQSIMKKMQLSSSMGVMEGFLLYPEAADIWDVLAGPNPALFE